MISYIDDIGPYFYENKKNIVVYEWLLVTIQKERGN